MIPLCQGPGYMGPSIDCFMLVRADRAKEVLRRYRCSDAGGHLHDALVVVGEVDWTDESNGRYADDMDHADPRWPGKCSCGEPFRDDDEWQHGFDRLYRRQDTGELVLLHDAPPGSIYEADWYPWKGPDGHCLVCMLPGRHPWIMDGPSRDGGRWTRTGTAPRLTVRPSIVVDGWHGFLTDGRLVSC